MYTNLISKLSKDIKVLFNEPMKNHTTFKIGGPAEVMIIAETEDDILEIVNFTRMNKIDLFVLGNGSNLLVSDAGIRGIVLKLGSSFGDISCSADELVCKSGGNITKSAKVAGDNGLTGMEWAYGIPGTVGGAVVMNAGAYGGEISQVLTETKYIDEDGKICVLKNKEHEFGYRRSIFNFNNSNKIILESKFKLKDGKKEEIELKMEEYLNSRKDKQPLNFPSAGSVFKRPKDTFAGKIIEELGLKGYNIGGAKVSEKHAGFIVNFNNATASDVVNLIEYIKMRVAEKYSTELETEIKFVGF